MANDERIGAWRTRHSRWPVSSPSPYMVVGLFFFCPYIKKRQKRGKQNNLLKGKVAMRHSSYYAGVSGGVSMISETSTFMYIDTTYFNYNLLRKELTSIV